MDAVTTACAEASSSREARASSRGTQTTPPSPQEAPSAACRATATASLGGPLTVAGSAGSTGVSSTVTRTLPTCTPLAKYSNACGSSAMEKRVMGNRGRLGISPQTSSSNRRHWSGYWSMSTSKCAAAYVRPPMNGPSPSCVSSYWSRFPSSMNLPKGRNSLSDAVMASPLNEFRTTSTPSPLVARRTPRSKAETSRESKTAVTPNDKRRACFWAVEAVA
mmetsp:Transcript_10396/g.24459  ORF Transcript_10396/g.24459 Transcript_10396/m.24459 type:complete len:220 (+) Transcript_10396:571-1230(+)